MIPDVAMSTPSSIGVEGGGEVFAVGDELVIRSQVPPRLEPYPGASVPDFGDRVRFPIPDQPGMYGTRDEFLAAPKFMAQFVHWPERVKCVLEGRYFDLPPVHFEGIFTLVCNFMCPHCSRRVTRTEWVEGGTWENNTEIERANTMDGVGLRKMLDEIATMAVDDQMGVIWGGGDPTANPYTYDGMLYAKRKGITSSFLTNGVFLDVERTLDADPILIRVSLNCGTEKSYIKFHGYPKAWDYFDRVRAQMRLLARRKIERSARTLVGISLIVDERNLHDLVAAAHEVRAVHEESSGGVDYCIVRPVMNYAHFPREWARLQPDTKKRAEELISEGGEVHSILLEAGVPLIAIKDSFSEPPPPEADFYRRSTDCLAYGMASEIRHNGDVQLCSDSYGNPEYTIGNLYEQHLTDMWKAPRRAEVLSGINAKACFKTTCPHNSRGHHYNRLFHRIEELRQADRLEDLQQWITDLRAVTTPLGHSFFL